MGASALCSRIRPVTTAIASSCTSSSSSSNELDCVVNVRACNQGSAAITSYVASRWPDALPHVTPAAALRIWKELPELSALQALAVNGSILLVRSVRTSVKSLPRCSSRPQCPATLCRRRLCSCIVRLTITHTYTLQLPHAVCQLTGLQSLSIAWHLLQRTAATAAAVLECCIAVASLCKAEGAVYEGPLSPAVVHVADPVILLPSQFSNLVNLTAAVPGRQHHWAATALAPLSALEAVEKACSWAWGAGHACALAPEADSRAAAARSLFSGSRGLGTPEQSLHCFWQHSNWRSSEVEELEVVRVRQGSSR